MKTVDVDDTEIQLVFPGGIAVTLDLAGKTLDVSASVHGRPALVRTELDARRRITLDIVETRGPEE